MSPYGHYGFIKKLVAIQEARDKYGLSEGMQVTHSIYRAYGTGIIDAFEIRHGQVMVRVEWENAGSFKSSKADNTAVHGPGILKREDNPHDCEPNPNQSFRARKYFLKDK